MDGLNDCHAGEEWRDHNQAAKALLMTHRRQALAFGVAGIVFLALTTVDSRQRVAQIDDKVLKAAGKGTEWVSTGMNWGEQRYSPMTQITPANVGGLSLAWSYELGTGGGNQAATPLYSNGILYTVTNWSIVAAVDARTGKEIWRYDPLADRTMTQPGRSRLCCGVNSRGLALYEGKVLVPVIDGRMQALDAATGKLLWSSWAIPEPKEGELSSYSITMAPRVAKGKVFIGNAGAEFPPFRGYVSAFDVDSGKELWKFYVTPGDPAKGFENKAMELAAKTWDGRWWEQGGGGSLWDGMAYDPEENLLYFGTGNGTVWSATLRNGGTTKPLDNLYIASIVAVDADTGRLKWHYQCTPGDAWDYDAIQALLLADIRIGDRTRRVIMQANKNGYFYVLDRRTGEFISAAEMSQVSWATGIDPKTGRPAVHPEALYSSVRGTTVYPVQMHNTSQMSFNPNTGLIYVPIAVENTFSFLSSDTYVPTPGRQNFGLNMGGARGGGVAMASPPPHGPDRRNADGTKVRGGILSAWDPATQTERWFAIGGGQSGGGTLSLASNVVIQTLNSGRMKAFSADKGEPLLDTALPVTAGVGPPMTFMLDGKQYIAVMGGTGAGGRGRGAAAGAALEPTAAAAEGANLGLTAPTAPLTSGSPKLFVYALPN
jgi:quinohemoprotein ethanol dehydrogenase